MHNMFKCSLFSECKPSSESKLIVLIITNKKACKWKCAIFVNFE